MGNVRLDPIDLTWRSYWRNLPSFIHPLSNKSKCEPSACLTSTQLFKPPLSRNLSCIFFSSSRCVFGKCPQALSLRWAQTHKKNYRLTTATFSPWQVAAGYSGALSSSQVDGGLCFLSGHCELHPLNNDGIGQGECVVLCGKICSVASYQ